MLGKWYKLGHEDARNEQMRARLFCFTPSVCPLSLNGRVAQILSVVCTPRTVTCEYLKKSVAKTFVSLFLLKIIKMKRWCLCLRVQ